MANDPNIRRAVSSVESVLADESKKLPSMRPHDGNATDALLRIYLQKRIEGQLSYYKARIKEYDTNAGFTVNMGALIMAVSAVISAIGTTTNTPELALTTALLPALAALVASLRQLYQWEKQSSLYRDADLGLQEARLLMPDWDQYDARTAAAILPSLVRASEKVFSSEINQWGQIALGEDAEEADALNTALTKLTTQLDDVDGKGMSPPSTSPNRTLPTDFTDGGVG